MPPSFAYLSRFAATTLYGLADRLLWHRLPPDQPENRPRGLPSGMVAHADMDTRVFGRDRCNPVGVVQKGKQGRGDELRSAAVLEKLWGQLASNEQVRHRRIGDLHQPSREMISHGMDPIADRHGPF